MTPSQDQQSSSSNNGLFPPDSLLRNKAEILLSLYEDVNDTLSRHETYLKETLPSTRQVHYQSVLDLAERISGTTRAPPVGWTPGLPLGRSFPPLILPDQMRLSRFAQYNRDMEAQAKASGLKFLQYPAEIARYSQQLKEQREKAQGLYSTGERRYSTTSIAQHSDLQHLKLLAAKYRAMLQAKKREMSEAMEVDDTEVVDTNEEQAGADQILTEGETGVMKIESKARETTISFFDFGAEDDEEEED